MEEIHEIDWFNFKSTAPEKPTYLKLKPKLSLDQFIVDLASTCYNCQMCQNGYNLVLEDNIARDPHVFSNYAVSKVMLIGTKPELKDLTKRKPFSGEAGFRLNNLMADAGIKRSQIYLTNIIKCFGIYDDTTTASCESFIKSEILAIKPKLVIATTKESFEFLVDNSSKGPLFKTRFGFSLMDGSADDDLKKALKLAFKLLLGSQN